MLYVDINPQALQPRVIGFCFDRGKTLRLLGLLLLALVSGTEAKTVRHRFSGGFGVLLSNAHQNLSANLTIKATSSDNCSK
jgi:hypothetical protein